MPEEPKSLPTNSEEKPETVPSRKRWGFRLLAVFAGLLVFPLFELICLLMGWGEPNLADDPFVGFQDVHPLFVLNEETNQREIPKSRQEFFVYDAFPAKKEPGTFRIFCLGGSTVQGRPFSVETSFTTWLRINLESANPQTNWEVINCGGISYASYRLVPVLQECLNYEPDLIILTTGHNEFLEDRTYGHLKHTPTLLSRSQGVLSRFRGYHVLRSALLPRSQADSEADATTLSDEVDVILNYQDGLTAYHRDEQWRAGVIAHFEYNLRRLLALAENADVPVLLVSPPSNLCDCPPFKSEHREELSDAELKQWTALVQEAQSNYQTDLPRAVRLLKQAMAIDDQYAGTVYELARCYQALKEYELARKMFVQAKELDICPLRILSPMEAIIRQAAKDFDIPLLDAHSLLENERPQKILGNYLLVDHVHPSIDGHRKIAQALTDQMIAQRWVTPGDDWKEVARQRSDVHFDALDPMYFAKGNRTLETLKLWAQGRAEGPPIETLLEKRKP